MDNKPYWICVNRYRNYAIKEQIGEKVCPWHRYIGRYRKKNDGRFDVWLYTVDSEVYKQLVIDTEEKCRLAIETYYKCEYGK